MIPNPDEGWFPWIMPMIHITESPYRHDRIEIMREEWERPMTVFLRDIPQETNVVGLYWRVPRKPDNVVTLPVIRVERY